MWRQRLILTRYLFYGGEISSYYLISYMLSYSFFVSVEINIQSYISYTVLTINATFLLRWWRIPAHSDTSYVGVNIVTLFLIWQ